MRLRRKAFSRLAFLGRTAALLALPWVLAERRREMRRARMAAQPFPLRWTRLLQRTVPLYRVLPPELKTALHGRMLVFLDEKTFEACGGMRITDGVRLILAAHACLLIAGRPTRYYPRLTTILVAPTAFPVTRTYTMGAVDLVQHDELAGESWERDYVVLSWEDVVWSLRDPHDGYNSILHEFAHQLEDGEGIADTLFPRDAQEEIHSGVHALRREYARLCRTVQRGGRTVLDEYGTDSPSEFFAVATEAFFEKPRSVLRRLPSLYHALRAFYRLDPVQWPQPPTQQSA